MTLIASNLTTKGKEEFFLNDISFEMSPGKIYTIIGRTLSGKTTLLKTIAGLIAQDSGTLSFNGNNFDVIPVWKRQVAMVYQQFINYPHLNVSGSGKSACDGRSQADEESWHSNHEHAWYPESNDAYLA